MIKNDKYLTLLPTPQQDQLPFIQIVAMPRHAAESVKLPDYASQWQPAKNKNKYWYQGFLHKHKCSSANLLITLPSVIKKVLPIL